MNSDQGDQGERGERGERGASGDTGQRGQTGDTGERGIIGLTGIDGGIGLIGERGPTGDHGQHGEPGETGQHGEPGETGGAGERGHHGEPGQRGPQGFNGLDAPPPSRGSNWLLRLAAVMFLAVVILALATTLTGQNTLDRVRTRLVQIEDAAATLQVEREQEQTIEDCRDLYVEAVQLAQVGRDLGESDLATAIAAIPADATPEDRLEITRRAISGLNHADARLRSASQAFAGYAAIEPPPTDCPHPESP